MKYTLVVMAAGLGSRYGGNKQIEGVGPNNEILMEYSAYDAVRAGFERIVFVIKPEMETLMDRLCGNYLRNMTTENGDPLEVVYVFQDYSSIPDFYQIPAGRTKPFGTVHALLCAKEAVDGPFCVLNADDYYGADAYLSMYKALQELPQSGEATMVGYLLKNTASLYGTVSRGVCTVLDGWLQGVKETKEIQMYADGTLRDLKADMLLDPESVVSMNCWGFAPSIFPQMEDYFAQFLSSLPADERKAECLLPVMVDDLMQAGKLRVSVLHSSDKWFGMTYQEDRPMVSKALAQLHAAGVYPAQLK